MRRITTAAIAATLLSCADARIDCSSSEECSDGVGCTQDSCDDGRCKATPSDALCGAGQYCHPREDCLTPKLCANAGDCSDGLECTNEACEGGVCVPRPDDTKCEAGEYCHPFDGCVAASECRTAADCDDGIACTTESCTDGRCAQQAVDASCAPGELCIPLRGCVTSPSCSADGQCDDGQACTDDRCDQGRCAHAPVNTRCDDGAFCNGAEVCAPFLGCLPGPRVPCDDGVACTVDLCDEASDACQNQPEDRLCDDRTFCNGFEVCDRVTGCGPGTPPACADGDDCTDDRCDPARDACTNPLRDLDLDGDPDEACGGTDCDDGDDAVFTGQAETCNTVDDDCDDIVDDGVLGACGDCDPTCQQSSVGTSTLTTHGGATSTTSIGQWDPENMIGSEYSDDRGGLTVTAVTREFNDLWVPNTAESTLSRWDAANGIELARYRVGLPQGECPNLCCWNGPCNMPSRVVVDGRGDAYIANRGFSMQGTVSKIASRISDCVDRNGNGRIDTSSTATPMAWGADECILWTAPVGPNDAVLRAIAIDRGDEQHPEGYPWAGGYNTRRFWKLDPDTGAVLKEVDVPVRPYGAVVVSSGRLYVGTLDEGAIAWIDTATTGTIVSPRIPYPAFRGCSASYGITADKRGRIWMSGWSCNDVIGYDPASETWTWADLRRFNLATGRGITVDPDNQIWVAMGGDGQSTIATFDADGFVPNGTMSPFVTTVPLPPGHSGPSGVGADADGNIWIGHHVTSQLVRLDPKTGEMQSFTGPQRIYTYSDFTGAVRRTVIGRGFYTDDHDAGCAAPRWEALAWDAVAPAGSKISFTVRTASTATTAAGLDGLVPIVAARLPGSASPVDVVRLLQTARATAGRWMRVGIDLETIDPANPPVVRAYTLRWRCP